MSEKFIKLECPECGRKKRSYRTDYDPPEAALLLVRCPRCSEGCKDDGGAYFDRNGEEVSYFPTEQR